MLTHVTFTGWDDRTDLIELADFCRDQRSGTVEIAVLMSSSRIGEDRYPDFENAESILTVAKAHGQRAAVHLCGAIARAVLLRGHPPALGPTRVIGLADRVQVNVADEFWMMHGGPYEAATRLSQGISRPVIVQTRDPAAWPERVDGVQFLFDRSAGRGQLAEQVPPLTTFQVGYAGGLGPDNVDAFVRRLAYSQGGELQHHHRAAPIWIDMESGIREAYPIGRARSYVVGGHNDGPTCVSVEKCKQVMDAVRWALMPE